jgi:hypothetical protein
MIEREYCDECSSYVAEALQDPRHRITRVPTLDADRPSPTVDDERLWLGPASTEKVEGYDWVSSLFCRPTTYEAQAVCIRGQTLHSSVDCPSNKSSNSLSILLDLAISDQSAHLFALCPLLSRGFPLSGIPVKAGIHLLFS